MKKFIHLNLAAAMFVIVASSIVPDKEVVTGPDYYNQGLVHVWNGQALLREGDLVLRDYQEPSSQIIKNFSRTDKSYSHAGVVVFDEGLPYIYHVVAGSEDGIDGIRRDLLDQFCDPRKVAAYGIFRYDLSPIELNNLTAGIKELDQRKLQFDSSFSLSSDTMMYCSEMIKKTIERATSKRITIATTTTRAEEAKHYSKKLGLPAKLLEGIEVVTIDNLFVNPNCREVKRYNYREF